MRQQGFYAIQYYMYAEQLFMTAKAVPWQWNTISSCTSINFNVFLTIRIFLMIRYVMYF